MKIHQVRWCTLNQLQIRFQYVTNTLRFVGIRCHIYDKVVPKLCTVGGRQGLWGCGENGYSFSGIWGALVIIFRNLGSKLIVLAI